MGLTAYTEAIRRSRTAFPDFQVRIDQQVAERDLVVTRCTARRTHLGPFLGRPATARPVEVTAIHTHRIADGKLIEHWEQFDTLGLLQQLGILPASKRNTRQQHPCGRTSRHAEGGPVCRRAFAADAAINPANSSSSNSASSGQHDSCRQHLSRQTPREMQAVIYERYGPPDVLCIAQVERPERKSHEVLIKVRAAAVTRADCATRDAGRSSAFSPPSLAASSQACADLGIQFSAVSCGHDRSLGPIRASSAARRRP